MAVLTDFLTGIANKLRTNLGTTGTINAAQFSTKIDEVYKKGTDDFWKNFTYNGTRTYYTWALRNSNFSGTTIPTNLLKPKYSYGMFFGYAGQYLPSGINMSDVTLEQDNGNQTFAGTSLISIPDLNLPALPKYAGTYGYNPNLETIEKIRVNTATQYYNTFTSCPNLKNITIEGTIGQSGLSFKDCPLLTGQSIDSVFAAMDASTPGTQKTITFATANKTTTNTYHNDSTFWDNRVTLYTSYGWSISLL